MTKLTPIYGSYFSKKEITSIVSKAIIVTEILISDHFDLYKYLLSNSELHNLWICDYQNYTLGYDLFFIGRKWDSLKDDETGYEFRNEVQVKLRKFFNKVITCRNVIVEEYYYV